MNRIISTVIFFLCFAFSSYSQNSLSGKITNAKTGETLPGASVYFPDLRRGAVSGENGLYKIAKLPRGKFLAEVKYIGYVSLVVKVNLSGETRINFEMEEAITKFSDVVVTGVSAARARMANPVSSVVMTNEELIQHTSSNIVDAVSREPGLSQISTGTGISKPVIRGMGFNRVLVLQNGIRQEGQQWGDEHGVEIDEYSVYRVEIIKGPGSLLYGSDALAGVLNFLPPQVPEDGRISADFFANYQSNNNLFGWSGSGTGNTNRIHWLVRASGKTAGNYSNAYDGKVFNSGFNEFNTSASAGITGLHGYSNFHFSRFSQNVGLITGKRDSAGKFVKDVFANNSFSEQTVSEEELNGYQLFEPRQNIRHLKFSSDNMLILGKSRLQFTGGFQQSHRQEFEAENPTEPALYFLLNTFSYDVKFFFAEYKGWETTAGIGGMFQNSHNWGREFLIPEYSLYDLGGFFVSKKFFGKFEFAGGLRYDARNINSLELLLDSLGNPAIAGSVAYEKKFNSFNISFSNISYNAGASYLWKKRNALKLNVSHGFRTPNISELGSNGVHEGTFQYVQGNASLLPETSLQWDASLLLNSEHISFELAGFHSSVSHFIFLRKLNAISGNDSLIIDGADTLPVFQYTQGNAQLFGGEALMDFHPHLPAKNGHADWLHFENGFSVVLAEQFNQPDSSKYLPFIPAPRLRSELKADFNGKKLKNVYLKAEMEYYFAQNRFYTAYGTETATSAYALFNAGVGFSYSDLIGKKLFSVHLSLNNILNTAFQNHLSRLKYFSQNPKTGRRGVYSMGRNFTIKFILPLTFQREE